MDGFGGLGFSDRSNAVKKKRSTTSRRPRNDSRPISDGRDMSSLSSTPPLENASKTSSDENSEYLNTNLHSSRASYSNIAGASDALYVINNEDRAKESEEASIHGSFRGSNEERHSGVDFSRYSQGVLAPANWKCTSKVVDVEAVSDGLGNDNKVKKVKLKVGGVTRTIHAKSASDGASGIGPASTKSSHILDVPRPRKKLVLQENSDDNQSPTSDKGRGLRGVPWKGAPESSFNVRTSDSSRSLLPVESIPVRKSKRVPKKRLLDGALDDGDDNDDEIRYLEKLKISKSAAEYHGEDDDEDEEGESRKHRKISRVMRRDVGALYDVGVGDYGSLRVVKESKKSRSDRTTEDVDYVDDEDPVSDAEPEIKRKKARKEVVELLADSKKETTITTRQRALQTGKDVSSFGASVIEFPNGLPPAPPRKQKEKLSEVDQQLKKAEAAQRRRLQVEKAARESEAEAIRKILGQDSSRKKRENKIKKRQEEIAQEKAANAMTLASDTVRWVIGPSGTVVIFPNEMGFPSIFDPKPCSYPPAREKCAGPSCANPYKYRDSKSKLPLCSLRCYKAVHEESQPLTAC